LNITWRLEGWMKTAPVKSIGRLLIPTQKHRYLSPELHYGIKFPQKAILDFAKKYQLKKNSQGE
jgi:hypothetical protein